MSPELLERRAFSSLCVLQNASTERVGCVSNMTANTMTATRISPPTVKRIARFFARPVLACSPLIPLLYRTSTFCYNRNYREGKTKTRERVMVSVQQRVLLGLSTWRAKTWQTIRLSHGSSSGRQNGRALAIVKSLEQSKKLALSYSRTRE